MTEVTYQTSFNIGFSNNRSDILIHLTQWQYWWWFWFSFLWSLYYLLIAKIARFRTLKFRPRIATTTRPRGKWGDLLICLIPISWCINILINSNFLLKLIEWQNESSLFTIRIRGKQWYWIYKFDLKALTDILAAPKNIGNNKWVINFFGELESADSYLHILQLRSQNKWIQSYWTDAFNKNQKLKKFNIVSPQEKFKKHLEILYDDILLEQFYRDNCFFSKNEKLTFFKNDSKEVIFNNDNFEKFYLFFKTKSGEWNSSKKLKNLFNLLGFDIFPSYFQYKQNRKEQINTYNHLWEDLISDDKVDNTLYYLNNFSDYDEFSRLFKKKHGPTAPLRIIKFPLISNFDKNEFFKDDKANLFRLRFSDNTGTIDSKITPQSTYLTLKQKRYKRRTTITTPAMYYNNEQLQKKIKYSGKIFLKNNTIFCDNALEPTRHYRLLKKNKAKFELISGLYSKRLLRTQRTLVLPAHVNITAITNSYDVIHSWFVPGLGLKLDCVPGRATHHTFFIDNVGFYYGQCAEICGRYHHHMPIRVCALPFEHFLVWWYSFGLPRLMFSPTQRKFEDYYTFRKYVW